MRILPTIVAAAVCVAATTFPPPAYGTIVDEGGPAAVDGSYVVVLREEVIERSRVHAAAHALAARFGGVAGQVYQHALPGFEARLPEAAARRLAGHPWVRYVEQNHRITAAATQTPVPSWGLDRIDQLALPLNNSYTYPNLAPNIRVFVIDTGIRLSHSDFGGRAVWGKNLAGDGIDTDCHGHGTHIAGTIGGSHHGVAKMVTLVAVKVLDCQGHGTSVDLLQGIDYVTGAHHTTRDVANISVSGPLSMAVNDFVTSSIFDGVTYTVAAGNDGGADTCTISPGSTPNAITVGATTKTDARAKYSNIGECIDIFAPGSEIVSAWNNDNFARSLMSGTSAASAHAAGVAALIRYWKPHLSSHEVRDWMRLAAATDKVADAGAGSPNLLLQAKLVDMPF